MPTYTYHCDKCDGLFDQTYASYTDRKDTLKCECGGKAKLDLGATFRRSHFVAAGDRIYWSEALAVRPDEVDKTRQEDMAIGSTAEVYRKDGVLGFRSWDQKRKYMRDRGFIE